MELGPKVNWEVLRASRGVQKVPVCLSITCNAVTEDDQGALFLDATTTQRVLLDGAPSDPGQLPAQLVAFSIKSKGPRGEVLTERGYLPFWKLVKQDGERSLCMASHKLDLKDGPLEVDQHSHS